MIPISVYHEQFTVYIFLAAYSVLSYLLVKVLGLIGAEFVEHKDCVLSVLVCCN